MAFIFPSGPPSPVLDGRLSNPLKRLTTRRKRNQIVGALAMTTPFDALDWRSLSQQALDSGLNNGAAVAGSGNMVEGWEKLSAEMRAAHGEHLDLQYGPRGRNRIDYLAGRLPELGADAKRLVASGWSAGGHLTAMAMMNPHIRGGVAISGIYDLEPLHHQG